MRNESPLILATVTLLVSVSAATVNAEPVFPKELPAIAQGPFAPSWESLSHYEFPQWFVESKFGIWAHWSPQCQAATAPVMK